LINGDDILFLGVRAEYDRWKDCAGDVGLVVNNMKTYCSDRFAVINSRFFDLKLGYRIEYSRYSLAMGHNVKNGGSEGFAYLRDVWDKINNQSPSFSRKTLVRIFMKNYQHLCEQIGIPKERLPNLFIAKELGGLGIVPEDTWKWKISKYQRQLATYMIRHPKVRYFMEREEVSRNACTEAVRLASKLLPDPVPWLQDGKPLIGPLPEGASFGELFDDTLLRCIKAFSYRIGSEECTERYVCRNVLGRKGIRLEAPMSVSTIRTFQPALSLWR